jgi:hypothetical protein
MTPNNSPAKSPKTPEKSTKVLATPEKSPKSFKEASKSPKSPKVAKYSGPPRKKCKYAANCYRKNPDHFSEFCHPGDPDFISDDEDGGDANDKDGGSHLLGTGGKGGEGGGTGVDDEDDPYGQFRPPEKKKKKEVGQDDDYSDVDVKERPGQPPKVDSM